MKLLRGRLLLSNSKNSSLAASLVIMAAQETDQRLREIQREYLDFLDDDVSLSHKISSECPYKSIALS